MQIALLTMNLLVSFASAGASGVALMRPASLSGSSHMEPGELFYVRMYAARAIPLGFVAGLLPMWTSSAAVAWLLFTAASIQIVDVVIGAGRQNKGMTTGASIGAIVHFVCALAIWTGRL